MVLFDQFEDKLFEIAAAVPDKYFVDLNGGVMAHEEIKLHPKARHNDLYIMGEYHNDYLGRYVVLYYGSFMQVYGLLDIEQLGGYIRHTLLHELQHHLESLAGEKDLEIEDAIALARYETRYRSL